MFRSLKKRVKSLTESSRRPPIDEATAHQLDTPRRETDSLSSPSTTTTNGTTTAAAALTTATTATNTAISGDGVSSNSMENPLGSSNPKAKKTKSSRAKDLVTSLASTGSKVSPLNNFDRCIEASDAITASSSSGVGQTDSILLARTDARTGLADCSLLVSPDGDLLLVPTGENPHSLFQRKPQIQKSTAVSPNAASKSAIGTNDEQQHADTPAEDPHPQTNPKSSESSNELSPATGSLLDENKSDNDKQDDNGGGHSIRDDHQNDETQAVSFGQSSFSELMRQSKDDYESAIFIGNDMYGGDKAMNGFSAKGWSIPATTLALVQTGHGLAAVAHFCEQVVLSRKEMAARTTIACDNLRQQCQEQRSTIGSNCGTTWTSEQWEILDPRSTDFEWGVARVGPFDAPTSTLQAAVSAIEQYHFAAAEKEANRWRMASLMRDGVLPQIHTATDQYSKRTAQRQQSLEESSGRAQGLEQLLRKLKLQSEKAWNAVYKAEGKVTTRLEELMVERSRERQLAQLRHLQHQDQQQSQQSSDDLMLTSNMSDEVWDMVSSVAESMEHGSFEPTVNPDTASTLSDEASASTFVSNQNETNSKEESPSFLAITLPFASRDKIEQDYRLPDLRAAAMQIDDEIQEASDALLNVLTSLDTTRRSARIAAETAFVSAANAQTTCLRSLLALERESLLERLRDLEGLDEVLDKVDVRADLDAYIALDKKERGGCSYLGDDDDGGIASALAVLSSHVEGSVGMDNSSTSNHKAKIDEETGQLDDESMESTPEILNEVIEKLFNDSSLLASGLVGDDARKQFDKNTEFICQSSSGMSASAKSRRSTFCYAFNSKRSLYARISSQIQFEALTKVFTALLTGCYNDDSGVANAKLCMMLAQTFYYEKPEESRISGDLDELNQSASKTRQRRIYLKSSLVDHVIWSKDDFWYVQRIIFSILLIILCRRVSERDVFSYRDVALSQQISESLTHSGVMSNFERSHHRVKAEWAQTRKTKWHDLNYMERVEAASQVHAVVFAQLGALAHSMIELGCGLDRSFAFVRRMSIRNQLPSSQRTMLLVHLLDRDSVGRRELTFLDDQGEKQEHPSQT